MISLGIFILLLICPLLAAAWAVARTARAVGSSRGRFRVGLGVVLLGGVVGFLIGMLASAISPKEPAGAIFVGAMLLVTQLFAIFFILRYAFALPAGRTFAPFGAYVGIAFIQFAILLLILRPFVIEAFYIPTRSMSPTIDPGDRLIVNKMLRPRRLDLVAYWVQDAHPAVYCKRLIGLPGERLRFDGGGLYINDQPITLPSILAGRCHAALPGTPAGYSRYQDGETIVLGNDEFFFVGDNIDISADSRFTGPSRASSLVGVVDFIYWPLSKVRVVR